MKTNILALSAALLLCGAVSVSCSDQGGMLPDRDHLARKFDSKDRKLRVILYPTTASSRPLSRLKKSRKALK